MYSLSVVGDRSGDADAQDIAAALANATRGATATSVTAGLKAQKGHHALVASKAIWNRREILVRRDP